MYNNFEDTDQLCQSIVKLLRNQALVRCFIVDNSDDASCSDKIDSLKIKYSMVSILRPGANLGYFGAFNYFFGSYKYCDDEVIVLCNNDLNFSDDFLDNFLTAKYNPDVLVVCPDVITLDGVHQNPHVLKRRNFFQRLKLDLYFLDFHVARILLSIKFIFRFLLNVNKKKNGSKACYLHMGIGACYILLPSFLSHFHKLDYPHFLYGEEAYLSRQVHSVGGRLYFDPNLKVQHKESASLSKLPRRITYNYGKEGYWAYRKLY